MTALVPCIAVSTGFILLTCFLCEALRKIITRERMYDPNNLTCVICSNELEPVLNVRSMHITEIKHFVLCQMELPWSEAAQRTNNDTKSDIQQNLFKKATHRDRLKQKIWLP